MTCWRVWVCMLCGQQRPGCEGLPATPALWAHAPALCCIPASPGLLPCLHRGAARHECEKALSGDSLLQVAGELSPKIIRIKRGMCKKGAGIQACILLLLFFFLPCLGSMQTWWKCFFPDNILLCAPSTPLFIPSDQNPWAIFFRAIYIHLVGLISWFSNGHTSVWRYRHTAKFRWLLC